MQDHRGCGTLGERRTHVRENRRNRQPKAKEEHNGQDDAGPAQIVVAGLALFLHGHLAGETLCFAFAQTTSAI
jgi:hypothetical protein